MKLTTSPAVKILNDPNVRDYYICGDIHGMLQLLMVKLKKVGFDPNQDRLVCSGDLVDKGWQSREVAMLLKNDWIDSVLGNHESLVLNAIKKVKTSDKYRNNDGKWLYDLTLGDIKQIKSLFENLPYAIEIHHQGRKYGVVHADVLGNNWNRFKKMLLGEFDLLSIFNTIRKEDVYSHTIWNRNRFLEPSSRSQSIKRVDAVFCGHTITPRPIRKGNIFYLDTGAFMSHKLTVLKLTPESLDSIPAATFL